MIEAEDLKEYYPFNRIDMKFYPLLLKEFDFFEKQQGEKLYEINRSAENTKYLINGVVQITTDKGREKTLKSTSLSSKYPIGDANKSNTMDAVVTSKNMTGFQISSNLLDHIQVWNSVYSDASHDSPLRGHDSYEWVSGLLKSRSVQMLPQGNIQEMFMQLEAKPVKAGDEIVAEGDPGDFCYIIAGGEAEVFQVIAEGEQKVANLEKGALFGESALVSSEPRNASVRMKTDGLLMSLAGATFSKLLKAHVIRWVNPQAALEMLQSGATLVDVRESTEFAQQSIEGCFNIPVNQIRKNIHKLNLNSTIITCSNLGSRCASAAFTLATLGYDVYALQGGINGLIKTVHS